MSKEKCYVCETEDAFVRVYAPLNDGSFRGKMIPLCERCRKKMNIFLCPIDEKIENKEGELNER